MSRSDRLSASCPVCPHDERYDGEGGGGTDNRAFSAGLRMTW